MVRVKICGITNENDAHAAVRAGADALGFILWPESRRCVTLDEAAEICENLPPFVTRVAVVVNMAELDLELLGASCAFDALQLHGDESPKECVRLAEGFPRLIKALRPVGDAGFPDPASYPVGAFLLDAPSAGYGGSGKTFDWALADAFRGKTNRPVIIAGGLTSENVGEAIRTVRPYAVDVVSGVESEPGRKNHTKLRAFIEAVRAVGY
jgi:phosphoribosylanthranilate isomerase